jgi:hypothetical protein
MSGPELFVVTEFDCILKFNDSNPFFKISETFTPENVEVPVFKETFCNPQDIPFEPFNGRFADLLTDEQYRCVNFANSS